MAPRKATKSKKKAATAAKVTTLSKPKKKTTTVLNPFEKLDRNVSEIATMGERPDNVVRISKQSHDFRLSEHLPKLIKDNPGHNICISGGSPELSEDASSSKPNLVVILVPNNKLPPPFVAYKVKDELILKDLSKHKLSWQMAAPSVYILKSSKRMSKASIRALSDDSLAMEEHLQLWTIVPSEKLQLNSKGKLDIRYVNYAVPSTKGGTIPGDYSKGDGLQAHIENFVDQYQDELGDDPEETVKQVIKQAFDDAREELLEQKEMLEDAGYNEELLDAIKTVKIYPMGTADKEKSNYINEYYGRAHKVL